MKIVSAKFQGRFENLNQLPQDHLPEVAFTGRSNVGKSSLINCLLNRKQLALTSSTPGKTRTLNFYQINNLFYFVDLPGYGFARVSQQERTAWKKLIESYLQRLPIIKGVIQIIDSRHGFTSLDIEMLTWLAQNRLPVLIVATKIDKLPNSKALSLLRNIEKNAGNFGSPTVIPFSAVTKQGKADIWKAIGALLT